MGSGVSRRKLPPTWVFTEEESRDVSLILTKISGDVRKTHFGLERLKDYLNAHLASSYITRIFEYMLNLENENSDHSNVLHLSFHHHSRAYDEAGEKGFVTCLIHMMKGNSDQRSQLIMMLCEDSTINSMRRFLKMMLVQCMESMVTSPAFNTWPRIKRAYSLEKLITLFIFELVNSGQKQFQMKESIPSDLTFSVDELEKLLSSTHLVGHILHQAFYNWFPIGSIADLSPMVPRCVVEKGFAADQFNTILDLPSLMFISSCIPSELRHKWRLLFNSNIHATGSTTLIPKITGRGPTVAIICDVNNYIFGGYASESWVQHNEFFGASRCHMYSIMPIMDVYNKSDTDEFYMYFIHSLKLPPLDQDVGCEIGYSGVWKDWRLGIEQCKACPKNMDLGCPCLASENHFNIKSLEIWGVGEDPTRKRRRELSVNYVDCSTQALDTSVHGGTTNEWQETKLPSDTDKLIATR